MLRVGLTGGLASGKTFVGHALAQLGCFLVQADELGHQVLMPGGEAYDEVIKQFGRGILDPDGAIDRRRLAAEVFAEPGRLEQLNAMVHPPVIRLEESLVSGFAAREPNGIAVVEAAIMIETGSYKRFERLIVAVCREDQQIDRAMKRDGLSRAEALARMGRQMRLSEKRRYADYVIDTSGTKEETLQQVQSTYNSLRSIR